MLTFLRRIRRSLIDSGSTRKYLLYAIGEIVLVVIGILVAVQINNWNEWRKDRITQIEILLELQVNLELNIEKLESQIIRKEKSEFSSRVLLNLIENKLMYHDSLDNHFGWGLSFEDPGHLSRAGYESFKNIGTDILENKVLKGEIIDLFEDTYFISQTRIDRLMEYSIELVKLRQQHLMRKSGFGFTPFDYDHFIRDKYIHSWIRTIINSRNWGTRTMKENLSETQRVLQLIKDELGESE